MNSKFIQEVNMIPDVKKILDDFCNRELEYLNLPIKTRNLFTLEQKEDWLHGNLTLDEYIKKNKLRDKFSLDNNPILEDIEYYYDTDYDPYEYSDSDYSQDF